MYRVEKGIRHLLENFNQTINVKQWHTLRITHQGCRVNIFYEHPRVFTPSGALASFKHFIEPVEIEEHTEGEGTLTELSREGCRLLSDIPLKIAEGYHLILLVSKKSRPIIIEAAVVRWTQESTYGLKFTSMQPIHESHLQELLRELPRPAP